MAISAQRGQVSCMKTETFLNISIISKVQPLPPELRQLFNKDALEKLTQKVFNPLSYYLVSIVEPAKAAALSWPLYDTKTERAYRNELSTFIADYSGKGLLSPVMSSYLVNPACYKVTVFMFQLSQLAVQKILESKMKRDHQKKLYCEMTEKYKSMIPDQEIVQTVEKENNAMLKKVANHLEKRKKYQKMAKLFGDRIRSMEDKLKKLKAQEYIDNLVDSFVDDTLDDAAKSSIQEIKNVNKPAQFFDACLEDIDLELDMLESEWDVKMTPFIKSATKTMELTKALIERQTGEADKSTYMIEYNHSNDEICTKDLQDKVNSQQKYILKNIVKHERLSFPNLIRGYVVAVSYILKDMQIDDGVYRLNEYLQQSNKSYSEMVATMKSVLEKIANAESKLKPSTVSFNKSILLKEIPEIPPLPDLSDLSMKQDPQVYFDTLSPLGCTNRFNLRKTNSSNTASFLKPQNPSLVNQISRDNFLRNFPSGPNKAIAECSREPRGFTKQQLQRLLSTHKKSSSRKKHLDQSPMNITSVPVPRIVITPVGETNFIMNTASENRESSLTSLGPKKSIDTDADTSNITPKSRIPLPGKKMSSIEKNINRFRKVRANVVAMVEDVNIKLPTIVEEKENSPDLSRDDFLRNFPSGPNKAIAECSREPRGFTKQQLQRLLSTHKKSSSRKKHLDQSPMNITSVPVPRIVITPVGETNFIMNTASENRESSLTSLGPKKSIDTDADTSNITPKSRIPLPGKKTSSIEKNINRFRKVRANVVAMVEDVNIKLPTIVEEKENSPDLSRDDFLRNFPSGPNKAIAECSREPRGFTKQQLQRLLSTHKKSSSRKKHLDQSPMNITSVPVPRIVITPVGESNFIMNTASENRESSLTSLGPKKSIDTDADTSNITPKSRIPLPGKKMSSIEKNINRFRKVRANVVAMVEDVNIKLPTIVEEKENSPDLSRDDFLRNFPSGPNKAIAECSREPRGFTKQQLQRLLSTHKKSSSRKKHLDQSPMNITSVPVPRIVITPVGETNFIMNTASENRESSLTSLGPKKSIDTDADTSNITPKSRIPLPGKKTSSIEKNINRFRKVRANVVAMVEDVNIKLPTIVEEKENSPDLSRDDFLRNFPSGPNKAIAECSREPRGFTKQQLQRLLSTHKKSSSRKKHLDQSPMNITSVPVPRIVITPVGESNFIMNTASENRESSLTSLGPNKSIDTDADTSNITPKSRIPLPGKKMSSIEKNINRFRKVRANVVAMVEDVNIKLPTIVEEKENSPDLSRDDFLRNFPSGPNKAIAECSREPRGFTKQQLQRLLSTHKKSSSRKKHLDQSPMNITSVPVPRIVITPVGESNFIMNTASENRESSLTSLGPKKSIDTDADTSNITPKSRIPLPGKKTSSIEKNINRFRKVRANVVAMVEDVNIKLPTIVEEKENSPDL